MKREIVLDDDTIGSNTTASNKNNNPESTVKKDQPLSTKETDDLYKNRPK